MYLGMSGKEDAGEEDPLEEEDGEEDPPSGADPDETRDDSRGSDGDEPPRDTGSIKDIEKELREKEKEIADLRYKFEPRLQEKAEEIEELRTELEAEIDDQERRLDELREELTGEDVERKSSPSRTRTEETTARNRDSGGSYFPTPPSDRPPKAAGVILGVTGFLGLVASLGAGGLEIAFGMTSQYTTSLGSDALIATAAVSAAVSVVVFVGGWWSYKRKQWYYTVFAALLTSVFLTPVGLPALILLAVSERGFE